MSSFRACGACRGRASLYRSSRAFAGSPARLLCDPCGACGGRGLVAAAAAAAASTSSFNSSI